MFTSLMFGADDVFLHRSLLPVHFLTKSESGREEQMMRDWMDVLVTESGGNLLSERKEDS